MLGSMEKQCLKDIEKARTDERQHAARELEATKRSFADREGGDDHDLIHWLCNGLLLKLFFSSNNIPSFPTTSTVAHTTRDLIELEKLHDARVKRLESQLSMAKKRAAEARDQMDVLNRQVTQHTGYPSSFDIILIVTLPYLNTLPPFLPNPTTQNISLPLTPSHLIPPTQLYKIPPFR